VALTSAFTTTAANATIELDQVSTFTGAVSLATNGATADATLINTAIALDLGTVTVGRNLVVESDAGNITQTGVLTVGGTALFTTSADNADITLNSANAITGAVSFVSTDTDNDNTEIVQYTGTGGVVLGTSTNSGLLTVVATTGNITQATGLALNSGTNINLTAAGNIDVDQLLTPGALNQKITLTGKDIKVGKTRIDRSGVSTGQLVLTSGFTAASINGFVGPGLNQTRSPGANPFITSDNRRITFNGQNFVGGLDVNSLDNFNILLPQTNVRQDTSEPLFVIEDDDDDDEERKKRRRTPTPSGVQTLGWIR
jgi:hypothetical protein